jgi:hypothetical protein
MWSNYNMKLSCKYSTIVCVVLFGSAILYAECGTKPTTISVCVSCAELGSGASCSYHEATTSIYCCLGGANECVGGAVEPTSTRYVAAECDRVWVWTGLGGKWKYICKAISPATPWTTPVPTQVMTLSPCPG